MRRRIVYVVLVCRSDDPSELEELLRVLHGSRQELQARTPNHTGGESRETREPGGGG